MKMYQLHKKRGLLIEVFTDTSIVENSINKIEYNKDKMEGIRKTDVKPFSQLMCCDERTTNYEPEMIKLNKIDEYDIKSGKVVI